MHKVKIDDADRPRRKARRVRRTRASETSIAIAESLSTEAPS